MTTDVLTRTVPVLVRDARTGTALSEVPIEVLALRDGRLEVVAELRSGPAGAVSVEIVPEEQPTVRLAGDPTSAVPLTAAESVQLDVLADAGLAADQAALLADHLVSTRRVRADDVAAELAQPAPDSPVRTLRPGQRALLLETLERRGRGDAVLDPVALREGHVSLEPIDPLKLGGAGWETFPWARPDDVSYRDYLCGVFVLFAQQQQGGYGVDPTLHADVVLAQLACRFFQDFETGDRTEVPLNRLLVPIVTAILQAPTGSGFGFAIPPASIPAQGTTTDREHLDTLLGLTGVLRDELANRYRLPLSAPDSELSSPVALNIHTLSRILSDTAQGPVEPRENVVTPQLPGTEARPILWPEVVGSAPFFLRFDEWLARQQPFFGENLFALRTMVESVARGTWLTEDRKKFLEFHHTIASTQSMTPYHDYFATIDEVHRSADFLLRYGAADLKLVEVVAAIDHSQFAAAWRLADEAEQLLRSAAPQPKTGEDWTPALSAGNFAWPLSFAKRRAVKVTTITELTGTSASYVPDGLERFWKLSRPLDLWNDVVQFRDARDAATRLLEYQQRYLLPMLRAQIRTGLGDLPGAVELLGHLTGMHVGIAMLGTPAGMVHHPDSLVATKRVVAGKLRWDAPLGDRPYTARLVYDEQRRLDGPYPLTEQVVSPGYDVLKPDPKPILHPLEERYAQLVQAEAILAWADALYRTDDPASLERARELYKAVHFVHGEDPGTSAYLPVQVVLPPWSHLVENPRRRNQLDRARLALHQLEAGLNVYGYSDDAVPTLRYETLVGAAQRWVTGAKSAQTDYLAYLSRVEQSDLDLLAAKAQEKKARATVAIAAEVVENAKAAVVVAQKQVADVQKLIAAKQAEIEDANSLFSQFSDYFKGMKSSVSSMVDIGKGASEGWTSLSTSGVGDALGLGSSGTGTASTATTSAGLGSALGGLGVVGGFAAFAVLSTTTLQGMADAATKRQGELMALKNEALPAAQAAVRVQERNVTIATLQGQIAATDAAYATDLVNYQNERFLNRDFWDALAGVASRSLHRYLDLAGQAAWFAERALAYRLGSPTRVVKLGYFDPRMRDLGGPDRLALDLAELEAVRLGAARVTVPISRTYSLARDLPLAFGQLKATGTCTFTLTDDELLRSYPGTFGHRIRTVDVVVDVPGTAAAPAGILTNGGVSMLRRTPGGARVPLLRFADAYPVSEFRVRRDLELYGLPGEQLLPFEGTAFTTTWTLELPRSANPAGLSRITDVELVFDLQAAYDPLAAGVPAPPAPASRSTFVSALALDHAGLATVKKPGGDAKLRFPLHQLALPATAEVTNVAVLVAGLPTGTYEATLAFGDAAATPFTMVDGLASSNLGTLSDGVTANAQPLNAAAGGKAARPVTVTIERGADGGRLARARDVLLWVEYRVP
jgi:hypothetical protein